MLGWEMGPADLHGLTRRVEKIQMTEYLGDI